MNIGPYTFEEFKKRAAEFHAYPAPGLLLGGYMVAMAQKHIPEGVLFEALVETRKCLPDAVQLLTLCSTGNNWMKIINLGRYAVSLYDKYTGEGVRVFVDAEKLAAYPEMESWLLKRKPKKEQDSDRLSREIEEAGDSVCGIVPVRIHSRFLGASHMKEIGICPHCKEPYPAADGILCRGCQGEAPYSLLAEKGEENISPLVIKAEDAVGKQALHDMTEIVPSVSKGPVFVAGQTITAGDVCRLQKMGRFEVAVRDKDFYTQQVHENDGVKAFAARMTGANITYSLPPKEGKISFVATTDGLLCVDKKRLEAFNLLPDVMCASRQDGTVLKKGREFAGTRVIPLFIEKERLSEALQILEKPLFSVAPLRQAKVGILVTGSEVFNGLVEDKFMPIITAKVEQYGCLVVKSTIVADDKTVMQKAILDIQRAGADLLVTTGGLSVDPGDMTRHGLLAAGLTDIVYGAPVLPGAMSLVGRIPAADEKDLVSSPDHVREIRQPQAGEMQVVGVPACALYFKTTMFDIILPRLLAGRVLHRADFAELGEGGFCAGCKVCTWPKCFFVK